MTRLPRRLRGAGIALCLLAVVGTTRGCGGSATGPASGTISSVVITPDSLGLNPGATSSLHAEGRNAANRAIVTTGFFWSTSDSLVATVSQTGEVTAQQAGIAQISASAQGHSGFAQVVVVVASVRSVVIRPASDTIFATAPGNTAMLTATTYDASGQVLTGRPVLWTANSSLLTVNSGAVTGAGVGAGTATVTATSPDSGFPSGSAKVTVLGHVAEVKVSPADASVSVSGVFAPTTLQLTVKLTDSFGNNVTASRSVKWSSSNSSIAKVNASTGLVTAVAESVQPVTITATTADGATGSGMVVVEP
jgi:trimeric autotransporter adhesin